MEDDGLLPKETAAVVLVKSDDGRSIVVVLDLAVVGSRKVC